VRREEMDDRDKGLIKFLMRERHGTPFEHNSFRFHIRTPIFVAREWFRHRVGCLTGDTEVSLLEDVEGSRTSTMSELWAAWQARPDVVSEMSIQTLDEGTKEFRAGRILQVVDSGPKPVYRVVLADGKSLEATATHRLLTTQGWQTLRTAVGLEGEGSAGRATKSPFLLVDESTKAPRGLSGFFRKLSESSGGPETKPVGTLVRPRAIPVSVSAVEYVGVEQTYDLCVEGPWHNFVANGIVVHNSFNEESGRYHKLSDDFYVPAPEAVRTQVGKPGSYSFEAVAEPLADETIDTFKRIYKDLFAEYEGLIEKGVAKELARAILPFGIYTQFYWTLNARSLMNFLSLRNATAAQYEIRVYADAVERLFAERMPITHECFVEFGRRAP
jgi:thymidylate synthase ThyX